MTEFSISSEFSTRRATMGPLERSECACNMILVQLGLYAEQTRAEADGELTPALREQFAVVFAATSEPAEA